MKKSDALEISLLTLQEYSFTLAKLKVESNIIQQDIDYYSNHVNHLISKEIFQNAAMICARINFFNNINDVIHLKYAEKYCNKLITFDSDFEKLKPYTTIEIEILA